MSACCFAISSVQRRSRTGWTRKTCGAWSGGYQNACEAVVQRHDGFVAQYRGDSIEVYFGYPRAHEDDARRVVRCALDMLEAVRQVGLSTAVDLQVRIGIDCGQVVVGALEGAVDPNALPSAKPRISPPASRARLPPVRWSSRILSGACSPRGGDGAARRAQAQGRRAPGCVVQSGHGGAEGERRAERAKDPFRRPGQRMERAGGGMGRCAVGPRPLRLSARRTGYRQIASRRGISAEASQSPEIDVLEIRCTQYSQDSAFLAVIELIERRLGLDRSIANEAQLDRIENRLSNGASWRATRRPCWRNCCRFPRPIAIPHWSFHRYDAAPAPWTFSSPW